MTDKIICVGCGQAINTFNESYTPGAKGYAHVGCHGLTPKKKAHEEMENQ